MFLAFHDMNLYNILYKYDEVTQSLRKLPFPSQYAKSR